MYSWGDVFDEVNGNMKELKWWKCDKELLLGAFILVLCFFGVNIITEYSVDSYIYYIYNAIGFFWLGIDCGRLVQGIVWAVVQIVITIYGIPIEIIGIFSYFGAIIFLSLAVYEYAKMLKTYSNNAVLTLGVSFLTIANLFSVEYFLFFEKCMFMFAIYCSVKAATETIAFFKSGKSANNKRVFLYLLLAVFTYQSSIFLYPILCLPFIFLYSENVKEFIIKNMEVALFTGIPLVIGFLYIKVVGGGDRLESTGIKENVINTYHFLKMYLRDAHAMLPKFWLFIALVVLMIAWVAFIFAKKNQVLFHLLSMVYVVCGTCFYGLMVYWTGTSNDPSMRIAYPFMCIVGVILTMFLIQGIDLNNYFFFKRFFYCILVIFLCVEFYSIELALVQRYQANIADQHWCETVGQVINEYEEQTGNEIENISFYYDKDSQYFYKDLSHGQVTERALYAPWSAIHALNYYLNDIEEEMISESDLIDAFLGDEKVTEEEKEHFYQLIQIPFIKKILSNFCVKVKYVESEKEEIYCDFFQKHDWDAYSEEQLIFDGNTLHLCVW